MYSRFLIRLLPIFLSALLLLALIPLGCKPSPEPKTEGDVTFTDALGRTVTVKKNPERVAALLGSFADVWQLSGGTLCAAADDAWDDLGLEMGEAVNIGEMKSPSLELLLSSEPQLVLASASTASNLKMLDTLESVGITVAFFDVSCFDDYLEMLNICTDITERKDLYEQNGLSLRERIERVKDELASTALPEAQRKILFLRASSGFVRAKNSDGSILGEMLKDIGCINIADSDSGLLENLSIEKILLENPYRIFIVQVGDDPEAAYANITKMMEENPAWSELSAIKENRLHYMDKRLFNLKPNARWAEAYEVLSEIIKQ